ncbi:hypothetical protein [Vibrio coralliilyticus]|uniref:hypothetical protein n=1 Tax=Vibrio coralliilyticus TaxID=190893 RepID=UPI001C0FB35A|nr:hypothetical protein [Vibrio coralliilyticus]
MAKTPEASDHTSIKKRIDTATTGKQPKSLLRFAGNPRKHMPKGLPFELKYYIQLVEDTDKWIWSDKRGSIDAAQPILQRLNISPDSWIKFTTQFTRVFHGPIGRAKGLQRYCDNLNLKRRPNLAQCQKLLA